MVPTACAYGSRLDADNYVFDAGGALGAGACCGACVGAAGRLARAVARLEDDAPRCSSDPRRLLELTPFKLVAGWAEPVVPARMDVPYSLVMIAP